LLKIPYDDATRSLRQYNQLRLDSSFEFLYERFMIEIVLLYMKDRLKINLSE